MKKTARIDGAISQMEDSIRHINDLNNGLRRATLERNDARAEMLQFRIERSCNRYYARGSAFALLFDATFDELEGMALSSLGYDDVYETSEDLWSHTLAYGA